MAKGRISPFARVRRLKRFEKSEICWIAASVSAIGLSLSATPALAQEAEESAAPTQSGLQEIIVTAQRRGQNMQDIPVAVTAFTSDTLVAAGVADAIDLQRVDSSLQIGGQAGAIIPFIRGVGNPASQTVSNESSVPIYIDDVYYNRLSPAYLALNNIERVEVLKGPQGTLFGRNSSGGVIQIFTRDPDKDVVTADATVGYGNFDTVWGKVYASTPLSDDAAIDLSVAGLRQANGWGENLYNGDEVGTNKYVNVRSKMVADLTPTTHIRLSGFYAAQRTSQGFNAGQLSSVSLRGLPPTFETPVINPDQGFYDVNADYETYISTEGYGLSLKLEQELGAFDLVSISAYLNDREKYFAEGDMTAVRYAHYRLDIYDRQFSQEFQVKSKSSSAINWLLGVYYLNIRAGYLPTTITGESIEANGLSDYKLFGKQNVESIAGFGQATFPVVDDRTNVTLGLRYTKDKVKGAGDQEGTLLGTDISIPLAEPYRETKKFDKLTYKVVLDHNFADDIMGYVSFSRGYKAGTFNVLPLSAPPTEPEIVDAYEIGVKSELFNRNLRLNIAAFQNDISNPQVQILTVVGETAFAELSNAGKARTKGVEFDATAVPLYGLTLRAAGQYLYARFREYDSAPFNTPIFVPPYGLVTTSFDAAGNRLPQTPKWKLNLGANYEFDTSIGEFNIDGGMAYQSNFYWDPDNVAKQEGVTLFNASLMYTPASMENLSFRLFGNNLSNEKYLSFNSPGTGPVGYSPSPAEPRTYGIEVRVTL